MDPTVKAIRNKSLELKASKPQEFVWIPDEGIIVKVSSINRKVKWDNIDVEGLKKKFTFTGTIVDLFQKILTLHLMQDNIDNHEHRRAFRRWCEEVGFTVYLDLHQKNILALNNIGNAISVLDLFSQDVIQRLGRDEMIKDYRKLVLAVEGLLNILKRFQNEGGGAGYDRLVIKQKMDLVNTIVDTILLVAEFYIRESRQTQAAE